MPKSKKTAHQYIGTLTQVPLAELVAPEKPMRRDAADCDIDGLARSLKAQGLIQPITVKVVGEGYEVVAGDRRSRAARKLGWKTIPAFVIPHSSDTHAIVTYAENMERRDVSTVEEAVFYRALTTDHKWTQKRIAKELGRSESDVSEKLKLLQMPPEVVNAVETGRLSYASARELGRIKETSTRDSYFTHAINSGINEETARGWREQANADIAERRKPAAKPGKGLVQHEPQVIMCQCDQCGERRDVAETIAVRLCAKCVKDRVVKEAKERK